jgi:tRNA A-37 threonylcarbamoyl transferase component Bud32
MDRPRKTTRIGSPPGNGRGWQGTDATEIRDDGADRTEPSLPRIGLPQLPDERYRLIDSIGSGGFGDVYRAWDAARQSYVALKVLREDSYDALDRFKREFRTLQQLTHPGLVALHELSVNEGRWFFTMEFIAGVDFLTWVRAGQKVAEPDPEAPLERRRRPACDLGRLMRCARQLAEVLSFVHAAQHIHRDVKPSNVMVAEGERVVLLDFGLVKGGRGNRTQAFRAYGTPRYISPEQARGRDGAAASDWYAFGTMLYEAIAGRTPFIGTNDQVVRARTRTDAPPLGLLVEELDSDIDRFVTSLLAREPAKRPAGAEILAWLNQRAPSPGSPGEGSILPRPVRTGFVGRHAELAELNAAFAASPAGVTRIHVRGQSGIGKSALIEQFMASLEFEGRALVVRSRCFECESVPYKAFEGLIDELRVLFESTPGVAIPPGFDALVRLFPVLRSLDPEHARPRIETHDAPELRRRAMNALAELLERLAGDRPVALSFDDVQWGDVESAYLLLELARRRAHRRTLIVISYRSETAELSECVELLESNTAGADLHTLDVEPLPANSSRQLLRACTGARVDLSDPAIEALLDDADGNAFLIEELARYVNEHDGSIDPRMTLRRLLRERLGMLPHDALRLLRVVCVAGNPIDESVAALAANATERGRHLARTLIGDRRLRRVGVEGREVIAYHDRIRAEVVATLDEAALADTHLRIARAMQSLGFAKPETLLDHLLAAGQYQEAVRYAVAAARRASSSLAFDRAAELYDTALSIAGHSPDERVELLFEHAKVLSYKGRGAEAAQRYLEVAELAPPQRAHECRRLAAEQLLP